jgi:glycerol-3-phosphate dehydrogenase (NAD(P)+)
MAVNDIRVAVIGAGSWGTTVAALAAANTPTVLWARRSQLAQQIDETKVNPEYLPSFTLPEELRATDSLADAVASADVVVMAVPSHGFRDVAEEAAASIRPWVPVVSLSKGLERTTLKRMSEVASDAMPGHPVAVLTGPNLAKEILSGQPAASVVAIADRTIGEELQRIFSRPSLRVYTNDDVIGCEVAGVVKNVIAIAAGMAEGMGFGDNTRATLITRGLAEMTRLGVAMGGQPVTFAGLAGMGDLIATCSSKQSRNNQVGLRLGAGDSIEEILAGTNMVAEGVKSSPSVLDLARRYGVEMPITEQVVAVCHEQRPVPDALAALMQRSRKGEFDT